VQIWEDRPIKREYSVCQFPLTIPLKAKHEFKSRWDHDTEFARPLRVAYAIALK